MTVGHTRLEGDAPTVREQERCAAAAKSHRGTKPESAHVSFCSCDSFAAAYAIAHLWKPHAALLVDSLTQAAAIRRPEPPKRGTIVPVERYDGVFRVSLDKLGVLERRVVRAVFEAYLPLPRLTWRLRMLSREGHRSPSFQHLLVGVL
jgi:hypothetical protein